MNLNITKIRSYGQLENCFKLESFIYNGLNRLQIEFNDLMVKSRKRSVVMVRQVLAYILHKKACITCNEVGQILNGMDHSTVLYACRTTEAHLNLKYADTMHIYDLLSIEYDLHTDNTTEAIAVFANCPQF